MNEQYIGIDFGASTARIILGTLKNKKVSYQEVHRFPTEGFFLFNTWRWNVFRFWEEVKVGLKKIANLQDLNLKGIGIDSWGVNLVYLTEDRELACQPFHYRDDLIKEGVQKKKELFDLKRVYEITGIQDLDLNALVHLSGILVKYPHILKRTKTICMIPDFFNYLLTGTLSTEYTNATTTELFDAHKKEFAEDLLKPFGISKDNFPELHFPGEKIGILTENVQKETGLSDIPIYAIASHDTGSAVIGVPMVRDKCAYLSSGTWSLMGVEIKEPVINETGRKLNLTNEGGAFNTIRYLKNIMGLWLLQRSKAIWDESALKQGGKLIGYGELSELAEKVESKRSVISVDDKRFFNPENMVKEIQEFCQETGQIVPKSPGEITRCIYDSLAIRYKEVLKLIEEGIGYKIETLHIVGGGSQDVLLNQLTANELGIDVYTGPIEAAAVGNIMVQAYANGSVSSLDEIRNIIRNSFKITKYAPK
ncbi:MAG: rhamnulokinase [Candidatus Lokiarchaeota archaeon]|nr:rhamnulokinase [Candidatus Lokiarchaeota archaeon]